MNEKIRSKNLASAKEKYIKWVEITAKLHYVSIAFGVLFAIFYLVIGIFGIFENPVLGIFLILIGLIVGGISAWINLFFAKKLKASIKQVEKIDEKQSESDLVEASSSAVKEIATYFRISGLLTVGSFVFFILGFVFFFIIALATGMSDISSTTTSPYQSDYNSNSYDYDYDYDYNY